MRQVSHAKAKSSVPVTAEVAHITIGNNTIPRGSSSGPTWTTIPQLIRAIDSATKDATTVSIQATVIASAARDSVGPCDAFEAVECGWIDVGLPEVGFLELVTAGPLARDALSRA